MSSRPRCPKIMSDIYTKSLLGNMFSKGVRHKKGRFDIYANDFGLNSRQHKIWFDENQTYKK